jgi:hypothetical protein
MVGKSDEQGQGSHGILTTSQPAKFRYRVEASDKLNQCKLRAYERVRYHIAGIRELICVCDG